MRAALLALAFAVLHVPAAGAQSPLHMHGVDVHYSVVPSTDLPAESARRYAITRSPARAVLIVAVRRTGEDGRERALPATIAGSVVNAAGQAEPLQLRELREGDAVSYLAEPRIAQTDVLRFELTISSPEIAAAIPLRFEQAFFPPLQGAR